MICLALILSAKICRLDFFHLLPCLWYFSCGGSKRLCPHSDFPNLQIVLYVSKGITESRILRRTVFLSCLVGFESGPKNEAEGS